MTFTQVFGGTTIYPADVSYRAISLSANQTLSWPVETATSGNVVAQIMDVTPTFGFLSVIMPPADEASVGETALFFNAGSYSFTVKDTGGNTIVSISPGLSYQVYLIDNSTVNGTWRSTQYAAGTSSATAGSLVGSGIKAISTTLNQALKVTALNANYSVGNADRASAFVWTGGAGAFTLPGAGAVGNDWFFQIRNGGTGAITVTPSGSEVINGAASLTFNPGDSAIIICDGTSFFTIGFGQSAAFAFDYVSIDLTGQSSPYTLSGANLNRISYGFGGTLTANMVVYIPATIQQYWISNDTSGGFTFTVKVQGQLGVVIPQGSRGIYYCNGTDLIDADTSSIAFPLTIAQGGTAATTAAGARVNLGGTSVGIGVFTAADAATGRVALSAAASGANSDITSLTGLTTPLSVAQGGTGQSTYTNGQLLIGNSTGNTLTKATLIQGSGVSITNGAGSITISATGSGGSVTSVGFTGGIITVNTPTTTPAFVIAGTSGGIPYFSSGTTWASSAALAANSLVVGGGAGAAPATVTTGTGVVTALGVNTGTAGAFVVNGGALGTPSSGTVTNLTGTASININGTVGATTPSSGSFTTLTSSTSLATSSTATVSLIGTGTIAIGATTGTAAITVGQSTGTQTLNLGTGATLTATTKTVNIGTNGVSGSTTAVNVGSAVAGATNTLSAYGSLTSSDLADAVGYKGIPQNSQTASYTLALSDMGKHISITTGGIVVPANGGVAFPIGATISVYNNSASSQTISITTDTMYLAGTSTTGSRTLAQRGVATILKVATTTWVISGAGLT